MNDYEGAIGSGADYPDQALARKASDSKYASDAADKAAGLASTKGQDVGLKRLFMGNIDKPDSEAGQQFGAGKARLDRMPAAPDRRESMKNMSGFDAVPTVSKPMLPPTPVGNMANAANMPSNRYLDEGPSPEVPPSKPKNRIVSKAELAKSGMSLRDFLNKERGLTRRSDTASSAKSISASDKPMPPVGAMRNNLDMAEGPTYNSTRTGPDKSAAVPSAAASSASKPSDNTFRPKTVSKYDTGRTSFSEDTDIDNKKRGGKIKAYAKGGSVSASSRGDGCAQRGKTRGMMR